MGSEGADWDHEDENWVGTLGNAAGLWGRLGYDVLEMDTWDMWICHGKWELGDLQRDLDLEERRDVGWDE